MHRIRQLLTLILVATAWGSAFYACPANAGLIGTDEVVATSQPGNERDRVQALVARPELAKQLQALGIPPEQAKARVNALSDQEVHALAGRLDALPAGGNFSEFEWIMILIGVVIIALIL